MVRTRQPLFPKDMNWGEFWVMFFMGCLMTPVFLGLFMWKVVIEPIHTKLTNTD